MTSAVPEQHITIVKKNTEYDIPPEYINKRALFMGMELYVDERVLVPRPETELLVNEAARYMDNGAKRVLEVGVGSGAISLALAKRFRDIHFVAVDISSDALDVFNINQERYPQYGISAVRSDLAVCFKPNVFDVICANLPYVERGYLRDHTELSVEPLTALDGGNDGLDVIRRLLIDLTCLKPNGEVFLEIGYLHKIPLIEFLDSLPSVEFRACVKDPAGYDRVFILKKKGSQNDKVTV